MAYLIHFQNHGDIKQIELNKKITTIKSPKILFFVKPSLFQKRSFVWEKTLEIMSEIPFFTEEFFITISFVFKKRLETLQEKTCNHKGN